MSLQEILLFLLPYQFSWLAVLFFGLAAFCYVRGRWVSKRADKGSRWRALAFWLGLSSAYLVMHTRLDYYAQFMFFIHRTQHLVLHHIAPFLIALSAPWATLANGFPSGKLKRLLVKLLNSAPIRWGYRCLQYPLVAPVLFVGLIYFWLLPPIHFDAMLSHRLYLLMNWSMWLDGLLFWWLILDSRNPAETGALGYGKRIALVCAVTVPQLILGAHITVASENLYDIYSLCGRAWPISPKTDQVMGGVITWIPPGMMSLLAVLVVLGRILRTPEARVSPAGVGVSNGSGGGT